MRFEHYLLLLLSLFSFYCRADNNEDFNFRHYSNKDGLSHNTVYHSIQDKRGFMWFATNDGLNRFDGQTFTVYRKDSWLNESDGLLHDHIISLFEDSKGRIWVCTEGGTCYYDYETHKFYPLKQITGGTNEEFFRWVVEDDRNNLWFVDYGRTMKYNIETREQSVYQSPNLIYATLSENQTPIFADNYNLYLYPDETDHFKTIPILSEEEREKEVHISVVREVPHEGYLVGTDKAGLKMFYSGTGTTETIIPDIQVRDIMLYQTHVYWVASESGVYIYNMTDKSTINLRKSLTNEYTIADNAVYSLCKDREGGVWLGSFFGGIDYLPSNHRNFKYYIGGKTHPGMLGNTVREIQPDKYGHLWLGTEDNGINRLNPQTGQIINYSPENPERKIIATNIHGLYPKGDTLWIGTFHKGIELLHIPTGKSIKRYNQANSGVDNFVHCFTDISTGEFLVGTADGVFLFDPQQEHFYRWHDTRGLTRQIYEDHKGRIWIPTQIGLYKYDPAREEKDPIVHYKATEVSTDKGLGSSNITSVFEDTKERIWVTTAYGFSLYDEETDSFNRITTQDGLPSKFIYRIAEDETNIFWISTANGLVRFDPETHQTRIFTHKEGLHESQFNYSSSYKDQNGTIYMGTIDGMISFNPQQFEEDTYSPPLYITRVQVSDDSFTVSYIAPSFTSPRAIRYSCILEGIDKDWVDKGTIRDVTFTDLPVGKYTFRVRSTNSSQVWQNNDQSIQITITPPFWRTSWAYLIYTLCLFSVAAFFYKYRKRKPQEQPVYETSTPPLTPALSPQDESFLQKLNAYIEANLTNKELNVEMIANEMGMSNSSLYRKVKGLSDLSPVDFIRMARLKKAVQLMQSGEKQVSEIAYQVGFSSPAYFSTCFQKQYGKSPSEFIKEMS